MSLNLKHAGIFSLLLFSLLASSVAAEDILVQTGLWLRTAPNGQIACVDSTGKTLGLTTPSTLQQTGDKVYTLVLDLKTGDKAFAQKCLSALKRDLSLRSKVGGAWSASVDGFIWAMEQAVKYGEGSQYGFKTTGQYFVGLGKSGATWSMATAGYLKDKGSQGWKYTKQKGSEAWSSAVWFTVTTPSAYYASVYQDISASYKESQGQVVSGYVKADADKSRYYLRQGYENELNALVDFWHKGYYPGDIEKAQAKFVEDMTLAARAYMYISTKDDECFSGSYAANKLTSASKSFKVFEEVRSKRYNAYGSTPGTISAAQSKYFINVLVGCS